MKKQIMNNIGLKILATIFSAILWLAVVNFNDPVITESFSGIKVSILNQDVLEDQDMVYEVIDNTDTVTVFITATRSTFEDLTASNIYAEADLKDVNYLDTVRIQLYTDKNEDEISAIWSNIENVQLTIEDMQRTQMVISTEINGTPSEGYVQGSVTIDQNVVRLSGPTSVISQIAKAVVEVSVDGMSSTINTSTELKLYDINGNLMDDSRITQNITQVNVSIEVLETKEVPIVVETTGTPAQGYITTGEYEVSRDTVTIAGRRSAIDAVQSIVIPESAISLTGRVSDVTGT
ncbi:MAG: CdaR family protein, partial [Eubacteriales bacterium]